MRKPTILVNPAALIARPASARQHHHPQGHHPRHATGTYASPLTIAPAGTIAPTGTRADARSIGSGGGQIIDEAGQLSTGRRRWPPASEAETPRLRTGRSFLADFFKKANACF